MSGEIDYTNNPLHGVGLEALLSEIVDHYGFDILYAYLNINCFRTNADITSSIKFLKKTAWARQKVEAFYLYKFKNLPRASEAQFAVPPRERVIPANQKPGEPAELSLEDAERVRTKKNSKTAAYRSGQGRSYGKKRDAGKPGTPAVDPWAKWRK